MNNPEALHQIGQRMQEAKSFLFDPNLLQNLQEIGHPYGLLLSQSGTLSGSLESSFPDSKVKALVFKKTKVMVTLGIHSIFYVSHLIAFQN